MTWGKRRAIVIGMLVLLLVLAIWAAQRPARLHRKSVLVVDASGQINEQRSANLLGAFTGGATLVLHDYVDAIDNARTDPNITGLVVRIGPLETGWAKLEEIRAHLIAFQASGKPSICYLGYDGVGNPEYYLASACKQIWLVPTNPISISGMSAEATFYRGALDKLHIVPEFYHIAEYKTAYNTLTEKKYTAPHREEVESLLHSVYDRYVSETSKARNIDSATFERQITSGPLLTSEAVGNHLVDRLAYWDQVQSYFRADGRDWNPVLLSRYRNLVKAPATGQQIAIVYASGLIMSGDSGDSPTQGMVMGGDSVASDIRSARNDSNIKAIILRVDSGGGSVVASEVIRREVELAHGKKPVIVSMSDVAASGGYWIATPADKIVADANTITGSIGVLVGKLNLAGLYNLLGISTDYVATSDNATLFSSQQNFTPGQREYIEKSLNETYAEFTKGVAQGRRMPVDAVEKIAKGRVWSGSQAKDLGLVDEIGGLDRAIEIAKQLAHIPAGDSIRLVRFPEEKSVWQQLFDRESDLMDDSGSMESKWSATGVFGSRSIGETLRKIARAMEPVQALVPYELRIR